MGFKYVILGSGMQGKAAAYDLACFGDAEKVIVADKEEGVAREAALRLERLTGKKMFRAEKVDVTDRAAVGRILNGCDGVLSAVPYKFNFDLTAVAISKKVHFCDLGGNTDVVKKQLELHDKAKAAGVTVCPDCGLAPGLGNLLAADGLRRLAHPESVRIRCGGLPQKPKPPLGYHLVFSVEGLLNEYFGQAVVVRDGEVVMVDTFTECEELEFKPPIGSVQAFVTSGGASTAPWSFKDRVRNYDYKTIRYPGHYEKFKLFKEMGLLETQPWEVDGQRVVPRDFFKLILKHKLTMPGEKDLVVLRVECKGSDKKTITYDLVDFFDDKTGFSAMERTTAYPATTVLCLQVMGKIEKGAVPIERSVPTELYLKELGKRDIKIEIVER